ncbi:hypothetical protein [Streptomyces sp. MI02-7b]|uniref:hypothetical protein n=1 Tax=Streptomyces sp. MI02-7b TaxID=462941 RepID=UPI0029B6616C|nr:hypothetical protein [Streptomyces sp. MI02-7b]MDX3074639.1 hypothetical protein [Streptomyces sp. MI02-7b]
MSDLHPGGFDAAASTTAPVIKTLPGGKQETIQARIVGPAELLPLDGPTAVRCTCIKCTENGTS